ncbi:DNA ligase D [Fredinandcohnia sp. FSL W7-1320]|uniref:DNA ligase D n=1 Tax=Fredinandcohnia sp. FSL W7-1320 TaxID=2954540 RepID=UPI0030FD6518
MNKLAISIFNNESIYKGSFLVTGYSKVNNTFLVGINKTNQIIQVGEFSNGLSDSEKKALIKIISDNKIHIDNGIIHTKPGICIDLEFKGFNENKLNSPRFISFRFDVDSQECTWLQLLLRNGEIINNVNITHPDKPIWKKTLVKKEEFISYLIEVSPYMLPFLKERTLTVIRFPHGTTGEAFYQKNCPEYAPDFINTFTKEGINYIICNDLSSLLWLGNQLAIEYHVPFHLINDENPIEIVFDLDPPSKEFFDLAIIAAKEMKEIFNNFGIKSYPKLSGSKGIQIHIPIVNSRLSYENTKIFTSFIAEYLVEKFPELFTIERLKKNRGNRLYIDYVQFAEGKTIICPYSTRGKEKPTVAAPLFWEEVNEYLDVENFTISKVLDRISSKGCPFENYFNESNEILADVIKGLEANK